jgi:hypothetical protein
MKKCDCGCMENQKEMFCVTCFHNFSEKESFFEYEGINLCPKCHPKNPDYDKIGVNENLTDST